MQHEPQDRSELEREWKERWLKAKVDLDAARAHVASLKQDGGSEGAYAYACAVMAETAALVEHSRVLRIYADLVVYGKVPDEGKAASGE